MIKVVQVGLGPLGQKVVRYALEREGIKIVGAVDPAPDKADKDLGELCHLGKLGVRVRGDLASAMGRRKADVAILTTVSSVKLLEQQIKTVAEAGLPVVSTCEELAFPWLANPRIARRIDRVCKQHDVACVGTGVNPGFLMDFLPCVMTSVSKDVKSVKVFRVQDASSRRIPFQKKIGAGLTRAQFKARAAEGTLRHVGLPESAHMIAHSLGWKLDRLTESLKPVMATDKVTSGYTDIEAGMARGVEQVARGYIGKKEVMRLHFRAAVGEPSSYDSIEIKGTPNLTSRIEGGVNGDIATCAITVNAARAVLKAKPGLNTMLDLPVPGSFVRA